MPRTSLSRFVLSRLGAVVLASLAGAAPRVAAAQEVPVHAAAAVAPRPEAPEAGVAADAAAVPLTGSSTDAAAAAPAAGSPTDATDAADGVSAGMPVWKLVLTDTGEILTAPARWTGRDWTLFGVGVAGVAALTQADKHLRTEVLRGTSSFETSLAEDFRPFGSYASFAVLGGFYAGGLLAHDAKAQETALDGAIAVALAAGVITPVLKEVVGRSRPSAHLGPYDFHPFSGSASFPSGETTQAFAVGSVIATEYPHLWVEILSYGTASLVAFARMREDAHWASDVVAGALVGTAVGRAVVHINQRLRARVKVAPVLAPGAHGARGLTVAISF